MKRVLFAAAVLSVLCLVASPVVADYVAGYIQNDKAPWVVKARASKDDLWYFYSVEITLRYIGPGANPAEFIKGELVLISCPTATLKTAPLNKPIEAYMRTDEGSGRIPGTMGKVPLKMALINVTRMDRTEPAKNKP